MSGLRPSRTAAPERAGQGLVEFTLVVPVILLLVVSVAELGLAFGNDHTIGYGSREGARVGSALATGGVTDCSGGADPVGRRCRPRQCRPAHPQVARLRPGHQQGRRRSASSRPPRPAPRPPGTANVWTYTGPGTGPEVDPGPGVAYIDFSPPIGAAWPACIRDNGGANPDSIGVTVIYTYEFVTPLPIDHQRHRRRRARS